MQEWWKGTPLTGIQGLVDNWIVSEKINLGEAARKCFEKSLHIGRTAERLIKTMQGVEW